MRSIKNLYFFRFCTPFILVSLSLLTLEGVCSLLYQDSRLDHITQILYEDQNLLWHHRPNLIDHVFQGGKINTDQEGFRIIKNRAPWNSSDIRIAILGASPSFGWGVDDEDTFSAKLQDLLNANIQNKSKISILNASQIGYSSHQGLELLKKLILPKKPTHIIVTYVINDLDYFRFFKNYPVADNQLPTEKPWKIHAKNFLRNLKTYKLLDQLLPKPSINNNKLHSENLLPRVNLIDYQENLEKIIQLANKNKIIPIMIKFPVNLPKTEMDQTRLELKIKQAIQSLKHDQEKKLKALLIYKQSLKYNEAMEIIAQKHHVALIDIVKAFQEQSDYLFIDPKLDTIHPNRKGHEVIAQTVYGKLKKILPFEK